jgi:hypothetical protein
MIDPAPATEPSPAITAAAAEVRILFVEKLGFSVLPPWFRCRRLSSCSPAARQRVQE